MSLPVINLAQMRDWEAANWAAGQSKAKVIRRVGQAIAARAGELTRPGDTILILAGQGHNGDDARVAQELLDERKTILLNVTDPKAVLDEFHRRAGVPLAAVRRDARPVLIIDGLFGIGLNRALDDGWKKFIAAVNASKIPVLAVDVPSGLNADTGEIFGAVIEAAITLAVGTPKIGLLMPGAWPLVGRLEVAADVGLLPCLHQTELNWTLPEDFKNFPPRRAVAGHKGSFGHLQIVAGSLGFHGAAVLAARAAQRARPGLISLSTDEKVYCAVASQLQSVMVNVREAEMKFPEAAGALLIGPGLAAPDLPDDLKMQTRRLWRDLENPLVVDASALDWIPSGKSFNTAIRVITPHPGEAARLLKTTAPQIQNNRAESVRGLSRRFGDCWVVLKGHQTLVGRSEGEIFVNPSGNPQLAQGGSGDVLAGFLAGLLAQPELQADAGKTIRYAVWQHGAAADKLQASSANWIVEDLPTELGNVR